MKNFKQHINESNIDKIKKECKKLNPDIDYSSSNWEKEFIDSIDWDYISDYKKLSEDFIEYFKDYIDWVYISWKQKLSESFIEKYKDKIYFYNLFDNRNISNELILNNMHWFIDKDIKGSFRFKDKEFKDKWNKYKKLFGS